MVHGATHCAASVGQVICFILCPEFQQMQT
jgi:hypothetical protein